MKPTHLLTLAALALAIGCAKATETLQSSGTEDGDEPSASQPAGEGTDLTATLGDTPAATDNPLAAPPAGTDKPDAAKPEEKPDPSINAKSVTGKYNGVVEIPQSTIDMAKQMAAQQGGTPEQVDAFIKQLKDEKITLELLADGTFTMKTSSQGSSPADKGAWTLGDDNTVTLTPDKLSKEQRDQMKAQGATDEQINQTETLARKPQILKVTEGGKVLSWSQSNMGMSMTVTFTRK
jgi:hypothetical protein